VSACLLVGAQMHKGTRLQQLTLRSGDAAKSARLQSRGQQPRNTCRSWRRIGGVAKCRSGLSKIHQASTNYTCINIAPLHSGKTAGWRALACLPPNILVLSPVERTGESTSRIVKEQDPADEGLIVGVHATLVYGQIQKAAPRHIRKYGLGRVTADAKEHGPGTAPAPTGSKVAKLHVPVESFALPRWVLLRPSAAGVVFAPGSVASRSCDIEESMVLLQYLFNSACLGQLTSNDPPLLG
jgi:hypothetical protein